MYLLLGRDSDVSQFRTDRWGDTPAVLGLHCLRRVPDAGVCQLGGDGVYVSDCRGAVSLGVGVLASQVPEGSQLLFGYVDRVRAITRFVGEKKEEADPLRSRLVDSGGLASVSICTWKTPLRLDARSYTYKFLGTLLVSVF